jgi:hypothetical protein
MQLPRAWDDGRITIDMNKGSFQDSETVYLFVIDADNTPSRGYRVNMLDTTAPPSPATLY